jgi:hypothetical protein
MKQEVKKISKYQRQQRQQKISQTHSLQKNTDILYALCIHLFFLSACFQTKQQQQQQKKMRHLVC